MQARALQERRDFGGAATLIETFLAAPAVSEARVRTELEIELALCRLRMCDFDESARIFARAVAANPQHPLLARFRLYPELMRLQPVLDREAMSPIPEEGPAGGERVTAVYFFLDTPSTTPAAHAGYVELMRRSVASLKEVVPGSRAMLITDESTGVDESIGFDRIERLALDPLELVHARLVALRRLLGSERLDGDVVLLDPDTRIARDFRGVFGGEFDLGFTVRSDFAEAAMDHEPLNVGVIFVRRGGGASASRFFELCLRHFPGVESRAVVREFYPQGLRAWRGDQVLPAAVVGWREYLEHVLSGRTNRLQIDGCKVAFFDSALYNCSDPARVPTERPYVLHFKGEKKKSLLQHEGPR